jgi:hypothetical protein
MGDVSIAEIRQLPRAEKLRLMESLWAELSHDERELASPAWHEAELAATAQRLAAGQEPVLDWEAARAALHKSAA